MCSIHNRPNYLLGKHIPWRGWCKVAIVGLHPRCAGFATGFQSNFDRRCSTLDKMLDLALASCEELFAIQQAALELPYPGVLPEPPSGSAKKAFGS